MSRRRVPPPARLVISAIFREEGIFGPLLPMLSKAVGEVRFAGPPFPFNRTGYYSAEMGEPLFRRFLVASAPVARDALPGIKAATEGVERELEEGGRRTVNLDPGLLTPENFILATGKGYSHRVYLGQGVFADLTLEFRKGDFHPMPWTYPDYASGEIKELLKGLRQEFMKDFNSGKSKVPEK